MERTLRIKVDTFISTLSSMNLHHFYFETIAAGIEEPVESFSEYLFQLVNYKELTLKYEVRCPEYDCGCKIIFEEFSQVPFGHYVEDYKGHEILVEEDNVVPYFQIPENLKISKEEAISQKKDQSRLVSKIGKCEAVLRQEELPHNPLSQIAKEWPITIMYIQNPGGDFFMSNGDIIHQVSNGNSGNLNQSIGNNVKNTITQSIDDHTKQFLEAKNAINASSIDASDKEDALVMLDSAEEKYKDGNKGAVATFLKLLPDAAKAIPAVVSLIQLFL